MINYHKFDVAVFVATWTYDWYINFYRHCRIPASLYFDLVCNNLEQKRYIIVFILYWDS